VFWAGVGECPEHKSSPPISPPLKRTATAIAGEGVKRGDRSESDRGGEWGGGLPLIVRYRRNNNNQGALGGRSPPGFVSWWLVGGGGAGGALPPDVSSSFRGWGVWGAKPPMGADVT